uniref:Beta-1,4-N-acetylgalactosaminyltransferase n=1 Tax=Takifugu rubripes TaxID=31033 RepID=H2UMV0_TAKRU
MVNCSGADGKAKPQNQHSLPPLHFLQYKGQANLHVFEDWCGSSAVDLRRNMHYPLYPHSRTTVQKLAVSPQWTNYGLRIFGYLHPYANGEFVFALSSDDNSELWLSTDDSPLNVEMLAYVGKTGAEWSAAGEFTKYSSQTSKPVLLSMQRRYFFEVIHKQNDRGTDHVEVAVSGWARCCPVVSTVQFVLLLSLVFIALLLTDVAHIPQTTASHRQSPAKQQGPTTDAQREDRRDSLYQVPLIDSSFLKGILPDCVYKPSYTIKDFPLQRYQGLQFVHMSYIYPNDFTRLTHMETENSCFYPENPSYMKMFGFSRYMRLDRPEKPSQGKGKSLRGIFTFLSSLSFFVKPLSFWRPRDEDLEAWAEEGDNGGLNERGNRKRGRDSVWSLGDDFKGTEEEDPTPPPVFDTDVNWSQTFQVNHLDLQAHRSDWIDLRCNVSGNLLLEAAHLTFIFHSHGPCRQFTLVRVVNVVKRIDGVQGSRYLLELELTDVRGQLLRLSHYIYALTRHSRHPGKDFGFGPVKPQQVLCNPVGFRWYPAATVHFIVPVKNQARWVQQLITDMEQLFRVTGDINFNLIITDYNSTDMDVRKALEKSSLPRYVQYVKLSGNFERSAGLQAGIDLINDDHSIVFLCDLHIYFPPSIIDTIRKHCVEGYMAFAPIVLRLDCGATPSEAKGYWEVNGFGLLGIYKSDLDKVGGMNTREFTDRWGGEDWELLDRILQAGMEVERIYLRNFFHHYHSKRGMWNRRLLLP